MRNTVLITANSAWNIHHFRLGLINHLKECGYQVIAVAPFDGYENKLPVKCIDIKIKRKSVQPLKEFWLLWHAYRVLKHVRPTVILSFTIKPNIYFSLAGRFLNIPVLPNITGLGAIFIKKTILTFFVRFLYQFAFKKNWRVFFQNKDDMEMFLKNRIVRKNHALHIPGSGIDVIKYHTTPHKNTGSTTSFLLIARMLWDKGIREYVRAAVHIKQYFPQTRFLLLGHIDTDNPAAIPKKTIDAWNKKGYIEYLGITDDVMPFISSCDCVVLPSYREGVPRTLLEAAAMEKPIITTDAPGCRDVVDDNVNGFLCKVKDAGDLAAKMEILIKLSPEKRKAMGKRGREKVVDEFDEKIVIKAYADVLAQLFRSKVEEMN